jgi:dTMP kinase
LQADLTLWLDVSLAESRRRRGGQKADRIEAAGEDFMSRVADGFAALAAQRSWTRIEAGQPVAAVTESCCAAIRRCVYDN